MKQAIEFAREILRKEDAIRRTKSKNLKWQYGRNLVKSRKELRYYCKQKGIDVSEVLALAAQ